MEKFYEIIEQKLLMAFVKFYGKKSKKYISERFNNCKVILYDEMPLQDNNDVRNHIKTNITHEELNVILNARKDKVFLQSGCIEEFDLLILPQNVNMTHWVHECNHMLSTHILSTHPLKSISGISETIEFGKGVEVFDEFLNEAVNQLMTIEILNILGEKAEASWQEEMFPIIDDFYGEFKEDLKQLFLSGNLDEFKDYLGKSHFEQFSQSVFRVGFKIRRALGKGENTLIGENEINRIKQIVKIMKGNVVGLTEDGNTATSHANNLEVVESAKSNKSNTSEKIDEERIL